MWITVRECEFFREDGSTFKIKKGTRLKEVSSIDQPRIGLWLRKMNKKPVNKNKSFVVLWFEGKQRMFTVNESVVRCGHGVGNIWRI